MKYLIIIGKTILNLMYSILKTRKLNEKKVLFISRQSNDISLDYMLLSFELKKRKYDVKFINYKSEKGMLSKLKYIAYILEITINLSNSKICIIDGYSIPISILNHRNELVVLQLWHALGAVKKFGYQCLDKPAGRSKEIAKIFNMHKNYTYITCSSEATKMIYSEAFGVESEKIYIKGMPRVDILNNLCNYVNKEVLDSYPHLKCKKNILYAPTFRKNELVDYSRIIDAIDLKKYNLIISKHFLDKSEVPEEFLIDPQYGIYELLNISDYIITDYSALSIEASLLNKPLYFYLFDNEDYNKILGTNINLYDEMSSATFNDIESLMKKITQDEYDYNQLINFKKKYIETTNFDNTVAIVDLITEEFM